MHMDALGLRQCTPRDPKRLAREAPFLDLSSGYVKRAAAKLPKQGDRTPWKLYQNYLLDLALLRYGKVEDGYLEFSSPQSEEEVAADRVNA